MLPAARNSDLDDADLHHMTSQLVIVLNQSDVRYNKIVVIAIIVIIFVERVNNRRGIKAGGRLWYCQLAERLHNNDRLYTLTKLGHGECSTERFSNHESASRIDVGCFRRQY